MKAAVKPISCITAGVLAALFAFVNAAAQLPYRSPQLPANVRARDLLSRMTVEEKFWQLFMIPGGRENPLDDYSHGLFGLQDRHARSGRADAELQNALQHYFVDSTRLGIPILPFEEGVHGLMRRGATVFPAAIALAASFDSSLAYDVGTAIASEARARGIRQLLSPVVNIASDVRWGRVEETYGEDPYLASVMARAYVHALESHGVIATPKHFVANVGEGGRDSYPIDAGPRALEERFYPPFRAAIEDAGARSVMTAYNSVDGTPVSQNRVLLAGTLKDRWKFKGFIISDQAAVAGPVVLQHTERSTLAATADALNSGLDVIFQSGYAQYRPYLAAFRSGRIPESVIDSAVDRVLRAKLQLGLFEHPYVDPDSVDLPGDVATRRDLARRAAVESLVLLHNKRETLPLPRGIGSVALIGIDAAEARLGGYTLDAVSRVSILDALRSRIGSRVHYAAGPGRFDSTYTAVPPVAFDSLRGEYFDNIALAGEPKQVRHDRTIDYHWTFAPPAPGVPADWYSVRWTGLLRIPPGGVRHLGVEGSDGYRLYIDDKLLIDDWRKQSDRVSLLPVELTPGSLHRLRLEFFESAGRARVRLIWDGGVTSDAEQAIDSAVALTRRSDAAIIVAGIEEGEFRDRASLRLPGRQEELIQRVAAVGKPVIVVLIGGSAITMRNWIDSVSAVLMAWYPGAEGGNAISDVLFGDADPAGRLPITLPITEGQLPLYYDHEPTGRGDDYVNLTGQPAFPFGFGLSYTHFEYSNLRIEPPALHAGEKAIVTFSVKNGGSRAGDEVAQLYVRYPLSVVARPVMALKAFTRLRLEPGEQRDVTLILPAASFRALDNRMHWTIEPGVRRILVGASSNDIRLRGDLRVLTP
jgi:beta-glucosidase